MIDVKDKKDVRLKRYITSILPVFLWAVLLGSFLGGGLAYAQPDDDPAAVTCIPGLPCVTVLTTDQLANPLSGPNADKLELPSSVVPAAAVDGTTPSTGGSSGFVLKPSKGAVTDGLKPTISIVAPTISPSAAVLSADADALKTNICDANFMNQITAKAFLEAERETLVNSTVLKKPDSVLEYSCFDQDVAQVVTMGAPIFSGVGGGSGTLTMDLAVENLVLKSLSEYVDIHFFHTYLGGVSSFDNNISNIVAGVESVCDHIYNMQYSSQCENIDSTVPFLDFDYLLVNDPRNYLSDPRMQCTGAPQITQALIDVAENLDRAYVFFDPVDVALPMTLPLLSADMCENSLAVQTGVPIETETAILDSNDERQLLSQNNFQEKICTVPGCFYSVAENKCCADFNADTGACVDY